MDDKDVFYIKEKITDIDKKIDMLFEKWDKTENLVIRHDEILKAKWRIIIAFIFPVITAITAGIIIKIL